MNKKNYLTCIQGINLLPYECTSSKWFKKTTFFGKHMFDTCHSFLQPLTLVIMFYLELSSRLSIKIMDWIDFFLQWFSISASQLEINQFHSPFAIVLSKMASKMALELFQKNLHNAITFHFPLDYSNPPKLSKLVKKSPLCNGLCNLKWNCGVCNY